MSEWIEPKQMKTPKMIWVCEVTWMRRKGKPVEPCGMTTGGILQAIFLCKEISERLKVPQSWVNPHAYRRSRKPSGAEGAPK